ncbi:hypothetical protein [Bacteroides sp. L10-4]|uniref:hypothetical protein n=1 Tax=Bacteroides sp. L10-4 TaxID=2746063 RepID=UPI0020D234E0|nr:hypothetical protein [Bacteroides sp. L10-4]
MNKAMTNIISRLKEVNGIVGGYDGGAMPFEEAFALARFYYDFQDTNALIADAEAMAGDDSVGLRNIDVSLKAGTATLLNNIGRIDGVDFREIANAHSRHYHNIFQEASDELNPYWKRYCELNNRLDYLPLGSKEYAEAEKECEAAKAEHDRQQTDVRRIYAEYERENRRAGDVFPLKASHLYALAARLNGIAGSILNDLDRMEKGENQ